MADEQEDSEELLAELLLRWEESLEAGDEVSAESLCKEFPDLQRELQRRIQTLRDTAWMDDPLPLTDEELEEPEITAAEPRTLAGRYRLDSLIAEGGFAHVWRGYDLELQRLVAVKVPKPHRLQSTDAFLAEARRVANLNHPGIVPVYDVGLFEGTCFIVSAYVQGGSLADHLRNNPPTLQQAVRWVCEIAEALEYAHVHGIVHRDIKPANILIDHHNRALLADFGIAQSASRGGEESLSLGTLRYMSPEQLQGSGVDHQSDILGLGVVLYEAVTGKLPYSSTNPNILRKEIATGIEPQLLVHLPFPLNKICAKALDHTPHQRHHSAAHFAADLKRSIAPKQTSWLPWIASALLVLVPLGYFGFSGLSASPKKNSRKSSAAKLAIDSGKPVVHWLNTATGVRHNTQCEHFRKTTHGRPCTASEGSPCKLCGG